MSTPFAPTTAPAGPLASERSRNYLRDLMLDKAVHQGKSELEAAIEVDGWLGQSRSQAEVSFHIDRLKTEGYTGRKYRGKTEEAAPQPASDLPSIEEVPEGRYALPTEEGATNTIAFYRVDRPTEGKWAGRIFAKRYSSDEEIGLGREGSERLVRKIAEFGAEASSALYGREKRRCGVCHRKLTNDESRARGIGPDCAERLGW
jgi:hypothetical protein